MSLFMQNYKSENLFIKKGEGMEIAVVEEEEWTSAICLSFNYLQDFSLEAKRRARDSLELVENFFPPRPVMKVCCNLFAMLEKAFCGCNLHD